MNRYVMVFLLIFLLPFTLFAGMEEFYYYNRFNPYASVYNSLNAFENPAAFGLIEDNQFSLFYQESFATNSKFYGAMLEIENLGLGVHYNKNELCDFLKYSLPVGFRAGDYMLLGFGLSIYDPVEPRTDISWDWYAGAYFMPSRFLNISAIGQNLGQPSIGNHPVRRRVNLGLGIKPFSEVLELYGDFSFIEHNKDIPNRYLVAMTPLRGLRIFFGINEDKDMFGGMNLDFTKFGFGFSGGYSGDRDGFDGKGFAFRYSKKNYDEIFTISKQVVVIKLDSMIFDGVREDLFGLRKKGRTITDVINDINAATKDNSVVGIILYVSDLNISLASTEEIRNALALFKKMGKKIIAFLETGNDTSYFISNIADKIIFNEGGSLYLKGGASQGLYFKNFFEKIGLRFDVVAAGEYKRAFEPLISERLSENRKLQVKDLLDSVQQIIDNAIISSRGIGVERLKDIYLTSLFSPERAKEKGLIDDISTFEQLKKNMDSYFGATVLLNTDYTYLSVIKGKWQLKKKIAIIYLNGDIVYGRGFGDSIGFESIGNEDISEIVKEIANDESISGVIVRINSPGGSALASQLIYEELMRLKEVKPLVVSIGSIGASGGYFSAIASDYIIADSTSIVGSIGVFFLKPDISGLLNKLGINYEVIKSKESGDSDTLFRGLNEYELKNVSEYIENFYTYFKKKVSISRKIDITKISELAEGKVYSGENARRLGLIDEIGGFETAERRIRIMANIPSDVDIEYVEYSRKSDISATLIGGESVLNKILTFILKERRVNELILYRYFE